MQRIRRILFVCVFFLFVHVTAAQAGESPQALCDAAEPAELTMMQFQAPDEVLEAGLDYRAILCTSAGAIYVDLYESLTPTTVNNFVFLAQQGYYDNTSFHRVIPGFMAQGGDPTATGRGGPGYQFGDEPIGFLTFDRPGLLAMANAGPGTNGSQFFITTVPTPHLNFRHTIFGDVLLGQANVEAIRERDPATAADAGETLHTVLIISDPSVVDNSEVVDLAKADEYEVQATFELFSGSLPEVIAPITDETGLFSTAWTSQQPCRMVCASHLLNMLRRTATNIATACSWPIPIVIRACFSRAWASRWIYSKAVRLPIRRWQTT